MNDGSLAPTILLASAMALAGLTLGLVYFRALRRTVDLLTGNRGWAMPIGLTLARVAGAVVLLTLMARLGAMPLLGGFLGFLMARMIALRQERRAG
jgi:N-ATPase, AtpR subunit